MNTSYDQLAHLYHLIFTDWNASIARQGQQLATIVETEWPGSNRILDVACGIGTQAIALAKRDYSVTASDLSEQAVARAKVEAARRTSNDDQRDFIQRQRNLESIALRPPSH